MTIKTVPFDIVTELDTEEAMIEYLRQVLATFALTLKHLFIRSEEQRLAARFGADYARYCGAVRRWL